jgi:hypothetical protein
VVFRTSREREKFEDCLRRELGAVYRGVPRPPRYQVEVGKDLTEALAWKAGVDATLSALGLESF